jgi:hypothetical protein
MCQAEGKTWKLKRTKQCGKCPWRVGVNHRENPNGYSEELHRALASTIAKPADLSSLLGMQRAMACHETHDAHCVGWLVNQLGQGNNLGLRIRMLSCSNAGEIQVLGAQHECFEDTLPKDQEAPDERGLTDW